MKYKLKMRVDMELFVCIVERYFNKPLSGTAFLMAISAHQAPFRKGCADAW